MTVQRQTWPPVPRSAAFLFPLHEITHPFEHHFRVGEQYLPIARPAVVSSRVIASICALNGATTPQLMALFNWANPSQAEP